MWIWIMECWSVFDSNFSINNILSRQGRADHIVFALISERKKKPLLTEKSIYYEICKNSCWARCLNHNKTSLSKLHSRQVLLMKIESHKKWQKKNNQTTTTLTGLYIDSTPTALWGMRMKRLFTTCKCYGNNFDQPNIKTTRYVQKIVANIIFFFYTVSCVNKWHDCRYASVRYKVQQQNHKINALITVCTMAHNERKKRIRSYGAPTRKTTISMRILFTNIICVCLLAIAYSNRSIRLILRLYSVHSVQSSMICIYSLIDILDFAHS